MTPSSTAELRTVLGDVLQIGLALLAALLAALATHTAGWGFLTFLGVGLLIDRWRWARRRGPTS